MLGVCLWRFEFGYLLVYGLDCDFGVWGCSLGV